MSGIRIAVAFLLACLAGCTFDAEEAKNCYYEATIGCGPGCTPRVIMEMIVCPNPPAPPAVDGGQE